MRRLERALDLPRHDLRRIADIALEAGFSEISTFNRAFRRRFDVTPSATRLAEA